MVSKGFHKCGESLPIRQGECFTDDDDRPGPRHEHGLSTGRLSVAFKQAVSRSRTVGGRAVAG